MSKQITLEGKTFSTIKEAAEYYNLDYVKIRNRLHIGWTLEEAFELVFRNNSCNSIIVDGKTFNSIREATEYYNLDYNTVFVRLKRGWSIEEAFELIDRNDTYKLITVEGKTFESVAEACRYYNLDYAVVIYRLNNSWSIEEAFELIDRKRKQIEVKGKEITVEGKTFNSIKEAAKYYNLALGTVNARLNRGWSIEEAFGLVERKNESFKPITVNGKTFKSIAEACRYYNLDYKTVLQRFCNYGHGWSIEEAFGLVERKEKPRKGNEVILEGKTFPTIKEACKYYNLNYNTVYSRLVDGWSVEEAFGLVSRNNNYKPITLEGKTFKSIVEAAKYYNLDYNIVYARLNRGGWSIEEAFGLVDSKKKGKPITIEGKTFPTIKEACKYYNLNYNTVYGRLVDGWSVEEAFELVPRRKKKKK